MAEQILPYLWILVALLSCVVLAILAMTLWEVRKAVKSAVIISERIAWLTDIKGWYSFIKQFIRKKDQQ